MISSENETRDQLSRMDVKLDVLIAQHGHLSGMVADHEARLRLVETANARSDGVLAEVVKDVADHEIRQRAADKWRYAMPTTALGALLTGGATIYSVLKGH